MDRQQECSHAPAAIIPWKSPCLACRKPLVWSPASPVKGSLSGWWCERLQSWEYTAASSKYLSHFQTEKAFYSTNSDQHWITLPPPVLPGEFGLPACSSESQAGTPNDRLPSRMLRWLVVYCPRWTNGEELYLTAWPNKEGSRFNPRHPCFWRFSNGGWCEGMEPESHWWSGDKTDLSATKSMIQYKAAL